MRRSFTAGIALIAAASIPLVATAPASATTWAPDLSVINFDCNDHLGNYWMAPQYDSTVTVEFTNCDSDLLLKDVTDSTFASTTGGTLNSTTTLAINTVTVTGEASIAIYDSSVNFLASIDFVAPWELPDPEGMQLATGHQDFDATPLAGTWGTPSEISNDEEIQIGGIAGCEIWPGEHIYATQTFTVATAGDYTFRVTGVDPYPQYMSGFEGADYALEDPMVALYSSFSVNNPSEGIVGCNDDLNDLDFGGHDYTEPAWNLSGQGDYIEGHYSYFTATLDPGDYTLVFTTWGNVSADDWAAGSPNTGRMYFDAWGPSNGLELTDGPSGSGGSSGGKLAETGVEPALALWSGLFLVAAGAVIMIARRRAQRA